MDPTLILIAVALAVFVFFQFRTSRKRAKETAERQAAIEPGIEIMTNYGLYGTVISLDDDNNIALIETTPGTVLKIHRQTILKVVEVEEDTTNAPEPAVEIEPAAAAPVKAPRKTTPKVVATPTVDSTPVVASAELGDTIVPEVKKPVRRAAPKKIVE